MNTPLVAHSRKVQAAFTDFKRLKRGNHQSSASMAAVRSSIVLVAALLGGCATSDASQVERTVFDNPYAATGLDRTGIGPQCEVDIGRDSTCLDPRIIRSRRGRNATLRNGETVRLTRAQVKILRERAALIKAPRNQPLPLPSTPVPAAPPIAESGTETP